MGRPARLHNCVILLFALATGSGGTAAAESVRTQEINECQAGELVGWGDGADRPAVAAKLEFAYNPAGAPTWFSEDMVRGMIAKAGAAWSQCGIPGRLLPAAAVQPVTTGLIVVQWNEKESGGNFGLANFGRRTLSLGPKAFGLLKTVNPLHDARDTLQMTISHEMGHVFGLMAHSRRCVDVLSYYHDGRGGQCFSRDAAAMRHYAEYRSVLPTACDIERCRRVNGLPPLPGGRLAAGAAEN